MRLPALLCAAVLTGPQIVPLCGQAILSPRGLESSPVAHARVDPRPAVPSGRHQMKSAISSSGFRRMSGTRASSAG